jgi:glycosyltransferase involved in cell wall biosynthesis
MLQAPLTSVVIPTFNRKNDLLRAVRSIFDQTYTNWEILIIDNYSTDGTAALIQSLSDSRIKFFQIHNFGIIAKSRNVGIHHSSGRYIAFLDSDDWWAKEKLAKSVALLELGADLVYHDLFARPIRRKFFLQKKVRARSLGRQKFSDLIQWGNALPNSSVVVRKSILAEVGFLDISNEKATWEDFDCWLRISQITEKFYRLSQPLGFYWLGNSNTTTDMRTRINILNFRRHYLRDATGKIRRTYWINNAISSIKLRNFLATYGYLRKPKLFNVYLVHIRRIISYRLALHYFRILYYFKSQFLS